MRRRESGLVLLVLATVVLSVVGVAVVGAGGAAAQNATTNNATDTGSETSDVVAEVDDRLRITSYEYDADNETMFVTLEHTDPSGERAWVTLTESIEVEGSGSTGAFGINRVYVNAGDTVRAQVSADRNSDGAAIVLVASERSVEQGTGAFVSDVDEPSLNLFTGAATWGLVRLSALGASGGAVLIALGITWHLIADRRDNAEVEI